MDTTIVNRYSDLTSKPGRVSVCISYSANTRKGMNLTILPQAMDKMGSLALLWQPV